VPVPLEMSDEVRLASLSCTATKPYTFVPDTSLSNVIRFVGYSEKDLSLIFFSEVPGECWEKVNWPSKCFILLCIFFYSVLCNLRT